ncbi:MAG: hypothetical protein SAK29_01305 [Scytonema sp. PMC 1069.18]|nr:hypothetical protein [Scytonema sp. PMC 1069.18]MEC4811912.1 hypothetical protein [Scytonema sp. PMC 1069.18]MEC4884985.1 hypothetical protein [Scytonema sp. PMC 1070.18]
MYKQVYSGLFIGSTILGITGIVQAWNTEGGTQKLAASIGIAGTTSALVCVGLGMAYDGKEQSAKRDFDEQIKDIERVKNRELTGLKHDIDNLKSQMKVLENQKGEYAEECTNLRIKLNKKAEEYLRLLAEKDLKISQLQGIVNERDTRVEDFLEECRKYTTNFFSLRYDNLDGLQKALEKGLETDIDETNKQSFIKRIDDIIELKKELNEAIVEMKRLNITDFKTVLDFIFTFDNKFLNVKTRWKDLKVREFKTENKHLRQSLDNSMPLTVASQRFDEGLEDVDVRITEKYEAMLINNNSIHAQLLDLLEQRNLVIDELQKENEDLKETLNHPFYFTGTQSIPTTGNKIADYYFNYHQFKLDCLDWEETETGVRYIYSIRRNPGVIMRDIEQDNALERIANILPTLNFTRPTVEFFNQNATVTFNCVFKLATKKPTPTIDDIFRECGVIRADKFCQVVSKHHIDQKNGKPTLRVMSATGGGKGIAVKNLVDYYLKHVDGYEIWLSDPQDGSSEDHWDCEKTATTPKEATELFNRYAALLRARDAKSSTDPNIPILGIFDEFDKKHDKDDKVTASQIWTTIRHHNMRMILIGQSGEVGKNYWQWDEMTNCVLLFITDAIPTFIKHATKDLGMDADDLEKFSKRYNKAKKAIEQANEEIDTENKYRLAALYVGGKAMLLEIPEAHKGELVDAKSWIASEPFKKESSMSINTQNDLISNILNEVNTDTTIKFFEPIVQCPHCGSTDYRSKGERWLCLNKACGKTWRKSPNK